MMERIPFAARVAVDEGGDAEMCELVEEYAKEYAKEAVAETSVETTDRILNAMNIGIEEACKLTGITVEKYQEYKMKNN